MDASGQQLFEVADKQAALLPNMRDQAKASAVRAITSVRGTHPGRAYGRPLCRLPQVRLACVEPLFYAIRVAGQCPTCQALEQEIALFRRELAATGRDVPAVQSIDENDLERELARWLSSTRAPDAAAGFRAGWHRLGQLAAPRLRDWEHLRWLRHREGDSLRSRIGELLRPLSRLSDTG